MDFKTFLDENESAVRTWLTANKDLKFPQRQDSTIDQAKDLVDLANKFGLYDAADLLKIIIGRRNIKEAPEMVYKGVQVNFDQDSDGFYWINYSPQLPKELDAKYNKAPTRLQAEVVARNGINAALAAVKR